jgi:hypothetical protein
MSISTSTSTSIGIGISISSIDLDVWREIAPTSYRTWQVVVVVIAAVGRQESLGHG